MLAVDGCLSRLALRDIAEAYGGLGKVAEQAKIRREALYCALSPKGIPILKTPLAVLKSAGMRLSAQPENHAHAGSRQGCQ